MTRSANRHRAERWAWSRSAVRAIVENPRYLDEVWGRVDGHEVLLDPTTWGSAMRR